MNFPLHINFRIFALAPQCLITDSTGAELCYVKQRLFKLRDKVEVFANSTRQKLLCTIAADRFIDFNANFHFTTPEGNVIGSMKRQGMKSLWRARYEVRNDGNTSSPVAFVIEEENPFVKVMDAVLGDIPVLGMFTGYFFNPRYLVKRGDEIVLRVTKRRALFQHIFTIDQQSPLTAEEEARLLPSLTMFVFHERMRG
jgi:uncharacterized protein YxjI